MKNLTKLEKSKMRDKIESLCHERGISSIPELAKMVGKSKTAVYGVIYGTISASDVKRKIISVLGPDSDGVFQ